MTNKEKKIEETLTEVMSHYDLATDDLDTRMGDFDTADELFRSYIDEDNWPYSSVIFVPRVFTAIFEKASRLIGGKPKGRLIPREGGDVLGAHINNEILSYQWDDSTRIDGDPLIAKWAMMDMNARKYGASFALCKWHYERKTINEKSKTFFDGPSFKVLNNRDVLYNPSYQTIKTWFQHREYLTLKELQSVNDTARTKPVYENLDELEDKLKKEFKAIDRRDTNYTPKNREVRGYQDYLGADETNRTVEIVTEYRDERWITFAPNYGVIIRDIPNPYKHQQIPVVMLKYYPIDDDIYGLSEIEPVEKLQKALNALTSQHIDAVNIDLYKPIGVDSTRVRMHTLEFGPGKKWIVTGDPRTAIAPYDFSSPASISSYKTSDQLLVGEIQEALGETSAVLSQMNPFGDKKTATEVKDLATQRLSRDNFNQIFLSEAIKRMMMFWHSMNQQFFFESGDKSKIIRIVGKDAINYFKEAGLDGVGLTEEAANSLVDGEMEGAPVNPEDYMQPMYPVEAEGGIVPKMSMSPDNSMAELHVEKDDLVGEYDYIADVESMQPQSSEQLLAAKRAALEMAKDPEFSQLLTAEGTKVKVQELMEDYLETLGFKDAAKYFEKLQVNPMMNGHPPIPGQEQIPGQPGGLPINRGVGRPTENIPGSGNGQNQGMAGPQGLFNGSNPQQMA